MPKDEFLTRAAKWYDKRYSKMYENYHQKGKVSPLHLPARPCLLEEYFGKDDPCWVDYRGFSKKLREYRNVVVHGALIGAVRTQQGQDRLVPKKEFIGKYSFFGAISAAAADINLLKSDFILEQEQMIADFAILQTQLNGLWKKPIDRLRFLLYEERNRIMLSKYDLSLSD